jgi:molybdate transport system substrate-binding protein
VTENEHQYGARGGNGILWLAVTALAIGCLAYFLQNKIAGPRDGQAKSLTVYCAAGVRLAVEEAAKQFEIEMGVTVKLEYANSGVLANRLKIDKEGGLASADIYIPADYTYIEKAAADGLTRESLRVATWQVVLGVKPGADIDVANCDEVLSSKLSFVMCDPLAGVGKKTKKMLEQSGHWAAIDKAKQSSFPTVTEAALAVKENPGTQAAFVWDSVARQHGLRVIKLPELKASRANISVAVTASTDRPTLALQFARFLAAPSKGGKVFARHKYQPKSGGDAWVKVPKLRVDCGGVNREALEKTIREFETREGCVITMVYAGCGTLVGKMQTGEQGLPDLFMTCDATYLDMAQQKMGNPFGSDLKISSTRIVMLVKLGNPKGLQALADLAQPNLRIGVTDRETSTLGKLSEELCRETGQWDTIAENIREGVTVDTAHTLIQSMEAGGKLDVVLVYEANIQHLKNKFVAVPLTPARAIAVQNIAARKDTAYPHLAQRLMRYVTSDTSRRRFEQLGFNWEAGAE